MKHRRSYKVRPGETAEDAGEVERAAVDYAAAGVDRAEGCRAVDLIRGVVAGHSDSAAAGIGAFAALHPIPGVDGLLLGTVTDGVGTKIGLSLEYGAYREVGQDCVAMCVNDLACHGVRPAFFLDYLACDFLSAEIAAEIVAGVAAAAAVCGAALVGGETAEMPGIYTSGSYDIAGFAVGTVPGKRVISPDLVDGDETLVAIPSSGAHSNGFSLVRRVLTDMEEVFRGEPLWRTLVTPTELYPPRINTLLDTVGIESIHGIAHITGGGLYENVPRMLPEGANAVIEGGALRVPPIFERIECAGVDHEEMFHTFNMGVGIVLAVAPTAVGTVLATVPESYVVGSLAKGERGLTIA